MSARSPSGDPWLLTPGPLTTSPEVKEASRHDLRVARPPFHRCQPPGARAAGRDETLLPDTVQAPVIVTFRMPADPRFAFEDFYERMRRRGYVIYPGKLTLAPSFRIGCIGRLGPEEMRGALAAVEGILQEMGVASGAPCAPAASGCNAVGGNGDTALLQAEP